MRKRNKLILFLISAAAVPLGAFLYFYIPAPYEEGVTHLRPARIRSYLSSHPNGMLRCTREQTRPEGLIDLPEPLENSSLKPDFFRFALGRREFLAALVELEDDRIYFWADSNHNSRLSDEKAFRASEVSILDGWKYAIFEQVRLDSPTPIDILYNQRSHSIRLFSETYLVGKIRLNGLDYYTAAKDGDYDGQIATFFSLDAKSPSCDIVAVDWDRSGTFYESGFDWHEMTPASRYIFDGNRYYELKVGDNGRSFSLRPAQPQTGTLRIDGNRQFSSQLYSGVFSCQVEFRETIELPAGLYQMHRAALDCVDETGEGCRLFGSFQSDSRNGQFVIQPNAETVLDFGPPLNILVETLKLDDRTVGLNPKLMGRQGEEYFIQVDQIIPETWNRGQVMTTESPQPTLSILDENDTEIESGQMEFG